MYANTKSSVPKCIGVDVRVDKLSNHMTIRFLIFFVDKKPSMLKLSLAKVGVIPLSIKLKMIRILNGFMNMYV